MQQRGIVHPRLMERVQPNFYPSLCTIQTTSTEQDEYGQEIGTVASLEGHTDIPCRIAPVIADSERRTPQQVYVEGRFNVALNGYYPAIQEDMVAEVDGTSYGIEFVGHDGNHTMTHLIVRLVE